MIGLIYLSAHLIGDFVLQTDNMAANKFDSHRVRAKHCLVHFALLVFAGPYTGLDPAQALTAAVLITAVHFLIDTRRWREPKDGFESYPVWVDQTLHIVSITMVLVIVA